MDRNTGSEDNSENIENTREAAENRDALAAQARRTEATTPSNVNFTTSRANPAPVHGSEDNTENLEHVREAEANRDALADQARRTAATTPPEINTTGPPTWNE